MLQAKVQETFNVIESKYQPYAEMLKLLEEKQMKKALREEEVKEERKSLVKGYSEMKRLVEEVNKEMEEKIKEYYSKVEIAKLYDEEAEF